MVGPAWVGDMVMAQSLFIALKARAPGCRLEVMAPRRTFPLLERMPQVDAGIPSPFGRGELRWRERRRVGRGLRGRGFTRAIVLPNSFKSALVPFHARIPVRTGWRGEWRRPLLNDCRRLSAAALPRMVDRFAALARPPGAPPEPAPRPVLRVDPARAAETGEAFGLDPAARALALCPGAEFGEAKMWPARHFAALAGGMIARGWEVRLFGSAGDRIAAESVLADLEPDQLARCRNLTGRTSLPQAVDLLSLSALVVSNDSGLMHVAAAAGRPVVGLYGSTSPDFTPPLGEKVKWLATDIECRPCFQRRCPYGHRRCLNGLEPGLVLAAARELAADIS